MPFQPGNQEAKKGKRAKLYRDALMMELAAAGDNFKELRAIARKQIELAKAGDIQAINGVADRLDGKPAQESTVTIEKRDATDWTRDELVAFLNDCRESGQGVSEETGRGGKSDRVH